MPRRRAWVAVLFSFVVIMITTMLGSSPASASNEDVHGRIVDADKPITGVRIAVTTPDGRPVG